MKHLVLVTLLLIVSFNKLYSQYVDCQESENNEYCNLEDLDGFIFTMNPPGGSVPAEPFCNGGAFYNQSWFSFVAGPSDIIITVKTVGTCDTIPNGSTGVKLAIWEGCPDFGGSCLFQENNCNTDSLTIAATNLTDGNLYNFVIDGCSGSVCTVEIFIDQYTAPGNLAIDSFPTDLVLSCGDSANSSLITDWIDDQGGTTLYNPCNEQITISNNYNGIPPDCAMTKTVQFTFESSSTGTVLTTHADIIVLGTFVAFDTLNYSIIEGNVSDEVCLNISGENPNSATNVEVSISPQSTAENGVDYSNISTVQNFQFPAGSSAQECFTIEILDDLLVESDETIIFEITNVSGGYNAMSEPPSSTTFTILDNDDIDGDGIENTVDNCVANFNPGQEDIDGDGIGNVCDTNNVITQLAEVANNLFLSSDYSGLIVKSANGDCWMLTATNSGELEIISVVCP